MRTVHKYVFEDKDIIDQYKFSIPGEIQVLNVAIQEDTVCMWVLVDTEKAYADHVFTVAYTGQRLKKHEIGEHHVGSFVWDTLVGHIFRKP